MREQEQAKKNHENSVYVAMRDIDRKGFKAMCNLFHLHEIVAIPYFVRICEALMLHDITDRSAECR